MTTASVDAPVSLGLGLLSIGRAWGYRQGLPPAEEDALALLRHTVSRGITYFDTAPAYGDKRGVSYPVSTRRQPSAASRKRRSTSAASRRRAAGDRRG